MKAGVTPHWQVSETETGISSSRSPIASSTEEFQCRSPPWAITRAPSLWLWPASIEYVGFTGGRLEHPAKIKSVITGNAKRIDRTK